MIIVNQDRSSIVNFENVVEIFIEDKRAESEKYPFAIGYETEKCCNELGYYETEERAKEVLEEININYANCQMINIPKATVNQYISSDNLFKVICFKMPEE